MKPRVLPTLMAVSLCGISVAQDRPTLKDEKARVNYSVGYQIGGDFKRQGVELESEILIQGIKDAVSGNQPLMTADEMRRTLVDLKKRIVAEEEKQRKARAEKLQEEGRKFLAGNLNKEGVITLPSGLQYKVIQPGTGDSPTLNDSVTVSYRGTKTDGAEFDSSYRDQKPATFRISQVIPGWKEALPMMKEGAKWQLFVPANLAFDRGPLEGQTLVYEIELIRVHRPK